MNTISKRAGVVARNISFRTEDHGDELVQATDVSLSGIMLSDSEIDEMLDWPGASEALFKKDDAGQLEPLAPKLAPLSLADKIDEARVVLYVGKRENPLSLNPCKLKGVTLERVRGGTAMMSCKVQGTPALDAKIGSLISQMGSAVQLSISYSHNAEQGKLDIEETEQEQPDGEKPARKRKAPKASAPAKRRRGKNGEARDSA